MPGFQSFSEVFFLHLSVLAKSMASSICVIITQRLSNIKGIQCKALPPMILLMRFQSKMTFNPHDFHHRKINCVPSQDHPQKKMFCQVQSKVKRKRLFFRMDMCQERIKEKQNQMVQNFSGQPCFITAEYPCNGSHFPTALYIVKHDMMNKLKKIPYHPLIEHFAKT